MRNYKQFVLGFLVGAMLFSIIPISATIEEYICYKADYKVMINGEEYISEDLPVLNYKGNTYAPFRSILEKAGLNVAWNAELNQAEVTSNPTSTQNNNVEEIIMNTTEETIATSDFYVLEVNSSEVWVKDSDNKVHGCLPRGSLDFTAKTTIKGYLKEGYLYLQDNQGEFIPCHYHALPPRTFGGS
jgi:hypothetical protein